MHKYRAKGATDITGFGLQGHAQNLATNQQAMVDFEFYTLPGNKIRIYVTSFKL